MMMQTRTGRTGSLGSSSETSASSPTKRRSIFSMILRPRLRRGSRSSASPVEREPQVVQQQEQGQQGPVQSATSGLLLFDNEVINFENESVRKMVTAVVKKYAQVVDFSVQSMAGMTMADNLELCGCTVPKVSLIRYIARIIHLFNHVYADEVNDDKRINTGLQCLLIGTIYIDRMLLSRSDFKLHSFNVHRVFFGAMMMAMKFIEDHPISVATLAQIGGTTNVEVNLIETGFCRLVDFNFWVDTQTHLPSVALQFCNSA